MWVLVLCYFTLSVLPQTRLCDGMCLESILTVLPVKWITRLMQTMIGCHTYAHTHPYKHTLLKENRQSLTTWGRVMRIHGSQTASPPLVWFHSSALQTCCRVTWFNDSTDCAARGCFVLDCRPVRAVVIVVCKKGGFPFIKEKWLSVISDIFSLNSFAKRCVSMYDEYTEVQLYGNQ